MTEQTILCLVCAWRENCQKKYSIQPSPSMRCPDFERDLTLKPDKAAEPSETQSAISKEKGGPKS